GVNIVVDPNIVAGKRAPALVGGRSVDEALAKLLEGSGLVAERSSDNTVVVKEQPQRHTDALETVNVFGTTIEDPILSSRTGDTLRERPQSITIVTRERLDQQNLNSVAQAMEQTTGITISNVSFTTQEFFSRGFSIRSIQLDGGAPFVFNNFGYNQLPDLAIYEQVEVLRGADALYSGNGKPGGTIQLVRKRPKADSEFSVSLSAGRWDTFRANLDATGTVGFDGALRGRVVYVKEDAGSFMDVADTKRDLLYGALEADLGAYTQVMVGATYDQRDAPHGGFGLPRYSDGRDLGLPRSTVFTADWARFNTQTLDIFGRLDQKFGDRWSMRLNMTRTEQKMRNLRVFGYGAANAITGLLPAIYGGDEEFEPVQEMADLTLKGSFDLFGRTHKIAVGADWQNIDSGGKAWGYPAVTNVNPYTFDPSSIPIPARSVIPGQDIVWGQKQNGAYVSLNLQITEPMHILGGARYSNYEYEYGYDNLNTTTGAVTGGFYQKYEDRDVVTPFFGFTYELGGGWVGYGSYGESFESQASYTKGPFPGPAVEPKTGESVEFGVKGGLWNGRAATQ
ncbi:TonB-dependent siderophore receptor, partial [Steroidobacter sp.]|uniref:TonB-dependent siderophore receptor n=1 Tax=Steroidobacter sp. TaxID=1978227 RepID=UPI001A37E17F